MTLNTGFDLRSAVVAGCRRRHRDVTRGVREVFVGGDGDRRPRSGTGMTRSARRYRCDEVTLCCCRTNSFPRSNVSGSTTIMFAIVTGLTRFKRDRRVIHRRIREGATCVLVAAVAIDFNS